MPTLDVTEYSAQPVDANGHPVPTGKEPSAALQQVTVGAGSTACANPFSAETRFVRVHSDTTCRIAFGKSPAASAESMRLVAGASEFFGVNPGDKVAVIQST